jgi:single-strand DNA-binding protein
VVVGLNKVMLIGYVGRAPEMRYLPTGRAVTSYSVAVPREWMDVDGERHGETEWFNVVAWDESAETCKSQLSEGTQVYVAGRLQTRTWQGPEGVQCFCTEIVADEMMVLQDTTEE